MGSKVLTGASFVRNTALLLVALFIDGLQAALSWGIATIAAFPGTAAGGVLGCAGGQAVAGQIGCAIGGTVFGILGTTGNALLAPVTIPIGIGIGLALNTTLSIVLGYGFLFSLLFIFGLKPYKRIWWSGAEMIPGINNIPCWTMFAISCMWAEAKNKTRKKGVLGLATLATRPVAGIMGMQSEARSMLGMPGSNLARPQTGREFIGGSREMAPEREPAKSVMRDIRPGTLYSKNSFHGTDTNNQPHAQAA
jgi:hypothetical protein